MNGVCMDAGKNTRVSCSKSWSGIGIGRDWLFLWRRVGDALCRIFFLGFTSVALSVNLVIPVITFFLLVSVSTQFLLLLLGYWVWVLYSFFRSYPIHSRYSTKRVTVVCVVGAVFFYSNLVFQYFYAIRSSHLSRELVSEMLVRGSIEVLQWIAILYCLGSSNEAPSRLPGQATCRPPSEETDPSVHVELNQNHGRDMQTRGLASASGHIFNATCRLPALFWHITLVLEVGSIIWNRCHRICMMPWHMIADNQAKTRRLYIWRYPKGGIYRSRDIFSDAHTLCSDILVFSTMKIYADPEQSGRFETVYYI